MPSATVVPSVPRYSPQLPTGLSPLLAVRTAIAQRVGISVENVSADSALSTIRPALNELDMVQVILALEDYFQVEVPNDDVLAAAPPQSEVPLLALSPSRLAQVIESRIQQNTRK